MKGDRTVLDKVWTVCCVDKYPPTVDTLEICVESDDDEFWFLTKNQNKFQVNQKYHIVLEEI